jgi:protease YdgD
MIALLAPVAAEEAPPVAGAGLLFKDLPAGCSAVLIAPDEVLTAAHCVPPRGAGGGRLMRFRTGDYPGHPSADFQVRNVTVHPLYDGRADKVPSRIKADVALVRLEAEVPGDVAEPVPLSDLRAVEGERLLVASWRGAPSQRARERRCPVVEVQPTLILLGCEVQGGESGAPVLRLTGDGPRLVGILSSRIELNGRVYGLAVPLGSRIGQLRALAPPRPAAEGG